MSGERGALAGLTCWQYHGWAVGIIAATAAILRYGERPLVSGLGLVLLCFLAYLPLTLPGARNGGDNIWYVPTARNLLRNGTAELSGYADDLRKMDPATVWINELRDDPRLVVVGASRYMFHPPGTAFLVLPFVPIGDYLYDRTSNLVLRSMQVAELAAKLVAAVAVGLLFWLALQLGESQAMAAFLALTFAFGTLQLSTHAGGLWSHNAVLLPLLGTLILLVGPGRLRWLAAFPLAFTYVVRPDQSIVILVLATYFLVHHRTDRIRFVVGGLIVAIAFVFYSERVYTLPLPHYYTLSRELRMFSAGFASALVGHAFSPNRGLFVYVPVFLFSVYGMYRVFTTKDEHPLFRYLAVLLGLQWLVASMWPVWWVGSSFGPRALAWTMPLFVLFLSPALRGPLGWRPGARAVWLTAFSLALAWSIFVEMRGVMDPDVYAWNDVPVPVALAPRRVWDWSDWQLLR